jgi:hypothetical protein
MTIDKSEALQIDLRAADRHADSFINILQNEITARGMILNGAIEEYNKFSALPESSSILGAVWDAAFSILSTAVPLLKLAPFIKKQHDLAVIAVEVTEAIGKKAKKSDKVMRSVTAALQRGGKLAKTMDEIKGSVGKVKELHKANEEVQTLCDHVSRKPILELIGELNNASQLWLTAKAVVDAEWILRLDDTVIAGTLEAKMKSILTTPPKIFDDAELDEIWSLYLYLLVGEHIRKNVKVVTTNTTYFNDFGRPNQEFKNTAIEGLNDNQWKQIEMWFGQKVRRNKIFSKPVFVRDRLEFVRRFSPATSTVTKMVDNGSWRRAKM